MSGDPSKLFTVTWSVLEDEFGDKCVAEFVDGKLVITFGPMHPYIVEQFLKERKAVITKLCDRVIERLNENGKNSPDKNEQVADQAVPQR